MNAPVRMAIIPFTVPANVSGNKYDSSGLGNELAWEIQAEALKKEAIPIVEVLNRQDWPAKKDEFFTGNFGALSQAREAGYDLVMVGYVEKMNSLDTMSAYAKIIDVDAGVTLWYAHIVSSTHRPEVREVGATLGFTNRRPDLISFPPLQTKLAKCTVEEAFSEKMPPG